MRSLEDAEQRLADARVNSTADKSSKNCTSPQKEPQPDDEKNEDNGHNADDDQEREKSTRSLPIDELSIHSRSKRTKSNKTSVISKTSTERRVLDVEIKALKEQEELQARLTELKQKEIADLQEELARKARIAEKEIERAKVSSSRGSSLRSISPVGTPDDNLSKVSDWMDKTEETENVASLINVPSEHPQMSVSAIGTIDAWRTTLRAGEGLEALSATDHIHRSRCARYWKGRNKDCHRYWQSKSNSTTRSELRLIEAVDHSQCRPESVSACVWRHPEPLSGAFQVPQLANTQKHTLPSQGPNFASNAKDHFYIRSSLPKLKLAEFSGDPLEWPEWSQLFQATVHAANLDDSVKVNHLKTMVTGKAEEAIAGLGYTAEMYNVAWNVLARNCGKPQMVVNAQLKRIYSFPPMKSFDGAALIKFARIVSSCVNVLTQFNYVGDLNSEGVLGSATRKLTLDIKTKWLTYVRQMDLFQPGLAVFSEWLNDIADVQDELLLSSNPNADRAKSNYKEKAKGSAFATSTTNTASVNRNTSESVL